MAKQSGLHQLRGKVGEHSYYRQTGIVPGLVRSINQGLSARVKSGAEYVNTRLNNAEFGQACRIAGALGKLVVPKFRPMILPFSQSKMAKDILEVIKMGTGSWGQRNVSATDTDALIATLNSVAKNDFSTYGVRLDQPNDSYTVDSPTVTSKLLSIGADGYDLRICRCVVRAGVYSAAENKYAQTIPLALTEVISGVDAEGGGEIEVTFPTLPAGPFVDLSFFLVIILPYREINSVKHVLQEACTYSAFAVEQ